MLESFSSLFFNAEQQRRERRGKHEDDEDDDDLDAAEANTDDDDEEEESWEDIIQEVAEVPQYIRDQNARGLEMYHQSQKDQSASRGRQKDFKPKHFGPKS